MRKEVADKWVTALRSGEYKQTIGRLEVFDHFCCLGVLCELATQEGVNVARERSGTLLGANLVAQREVREWAGIRDNLGEFVNNNGPNCLANLNDSGKTFAEIADIIEKNWESL